MTKSANKIIKIIKFQNVQQGIHFLHQWIYMAFCDKSFFLLYVGNSEFYLSLTYTLYTLLDILYTSYCISRLSKTVNIHVFKKWIFLREQINA